MSPNFVGDIWAPNPANNVKEFLHRLSERSTPAPGLPFDLYNIWGQTKY